MTIIPWDLLLCRRNQAARLDERREAGYVNASRNNVDFGCSWTCCVCELASANILKVAANEFFSTVPEKSQHSRFFIALFMAVEGPCGKGQCLCSSLWKQAHKRDSKSRHSRSAFSWIVRLLLGKSFNSGACFVVLGPRQAAQTALERHGRGAEAIQCATKVEGRRASDRERRDVGSIMLYRHRFWWVTAIP